MEGLQGEEDENVRLAKVRIEHIAKKLELEAAMEDERLKRQTLEGVAKMHSVRREKYEAQQKERESS